MKRYVKPVVTKHENLAVVTQAPVVSGEVPESDIRLKREIQHLTTLDGGMKIYAFKYLWSEEVHVGVMAQDLLANPAWKNAVVTQENGFYAVDYAQLGMRMASWAEWQAYGEKAVLQGVVADI